MSRRCWNGHLFASNVGVLPALSPPRADPRVVLSPRRPDLIGRKVRRRRRREGLLTCREERFDTDDLRLSAQEDCDDDC